jgi:hypothetical protein
MGDAELRPGCGSQPEKNFLSGALGEELGLFFPFPHLTQTAPQHSRSPGMIQPLPEMTPEVFQIA